MVVQLERPPAEDPEPGRALLRAVGIGLRLGTLGGRLAHEPAEEDPDVHRGLNLAGTTMRLTSSMGRNGYFFRLDVPVVTGKEVFAVGGGVYPLNVGVLLPRSRLMPFLSIGGEVWYVTQKTSTRTGSGSVALARAATGWKMLPTKGLALVVEFAYAAAVAQLDIEELDGVPVSEERVPTFRGGLLDVHLGIEWL